MKLAQALQKRKALRTLLANLASQVKRDAYSPEAKPGDTLKKMTSVKISLTDLSQKILTVNATYTVDGIPAFESILGSNMTLAEAKALRDESVLFAGLLAALVSLPRSQIVQGGHDYDDAGNRVKKPDTSIPIAFDPDVAAQMANQAARDARKLDAFLQEANWKIEIPGDPETV